MKIIAFAFLFLASLKGVSAQCSTIIVGESTACVGSQPLYHSRYPPFDGLATYNWTLSGGGVLTQNENEPFCSVQWTHQGSYQLTLTVTHPSCTNQMTSSFNVNVGSAQLPSPEIVTVIDYNNPCYISKRFSIAPINGAISYHWVIYSPHGLWSNIVTTTNTPYYDHVFPSDMTHVNGVVYVLASNGYCSSQISPLTSFDGTVTNQVVGGRVIENQILCSGGDPSPFTQLFPSTGSGTLSYQWQSSFDNITFTDINGATNVTYDPPAGLTSTTYYRRVTTSTLNGIPCTALSNTVLVTISPLPTVTADNKMVCQNNSIALTGSPAGGIWSGTGVSGSTFNSSTLTPGNYTVTYSYTNANGCSDSASATVIVNARPSITPAAISPICSGTTSSSISYSGATGSPNQYRIDWATLTDVPWTALPASPVTVSGLPTTAGTYTGTLFVRNTSTGCESTGYPVSITVNDKPTVTADNKTVCPGGTVLLTGSPAGGTWSGTGVSGSIFNTAGLSAGNYTVTYSYTNESGCSNSTSAIVTVSSPFTVSISGPSSFCFPGPATLDANISFPSGRTNVAPQYTYLWSNGAFTPSINITSGGTYTVTVTQTSTGCQITSPPFTVTASLAPKPMVTVQYNLCTYGYVLLTANAPDAISYVWSTGQVAQSIYVYSAGSYSVAAVYSNGCSSTSLSHTVSGCSPGPGPGDPCLQYAASDRLMPCPVEPQSNLTVSENSVYPNPASAEITVHLPAPAETDTPVKLYSQYGVQVGSSQIAKGMYKTSIETRHLSNGMYLVVIENPQRKAMYQKKVMVVHER